MDALPADIVRELVLQPLWCAAPRHCTARLSGQPSPSSWRSALHLAQVCRLWRELVAQLRGRRCRMQALPSGLVLCAVHQAPARALWLALWHRHYRANANPFVLESAHVAAGLDAVVRATRLPFAVRRERADVLSVLVTDSDAWWHAYRAWRQRQQRKERRRRQGDGAALAPKEAPLRDR
jgi:hypothetical protein